MSGTSLAVGIDFHAGDAGAGSGTTGLEGSGRGSARETITRPSFGNALPESISPWPLWTKEGFRSRCQGCRLSPGLCHPWGDPGAVTDTRSPACPFSENDTIYWVDMGLSTISRAKRDQTWREDVVTNGIGRVEGIAVDWIAGETGLQRREEQRGSRGLGLEWVFTVSSLQETSTGQTRVLMSLRWPG